MLCQAIIDPRASNIYNVNNAAYLHKKTPIAPKYDLKSNCRSKIKLNYFQKGHKFCIHYVSIIIMRYLIMKTVDTSKFYNSYGLFTFGFRARTKRPFEHMRLMGMTGLNGLAPLSCVTTRLVIIIM